MPTLVIILIYILTLLPLYKASNVIDDEQGREYIEEVPSRLISKHAGDKISINQTL